jgi:hypothetical protein
VITKLITNVSIDPVMRQLTAFRIDRLCASPRVKNPMATPNFVGRVVAGSLSDFKLGPGCEPASARQSYPSAAQSMLEEYP